MDKEEKLFFKELRKVSSEQLHNYPNISIKNHVKLVIKSLLNRKKVSINDNFFWPNGLLAISLEWCHKLDNDTKTIQSLKKYYDNWIKKDVLMKNLDYAINGYSLIYLYNVVKDEKYLDAIKLTVNYLEQHPKSACGSLPYRTNNPNIILVDSLGMICPFLCRYTALSKDDRPLELAIKQLTNFLKLGMDQETFLPYHGYDSNNKTKLGIIGWGRAVGWLLIGLVDSLEFIPKSHPEYDLLLESYQKIVSNVVNYQNDNGDFTWQISARDSYIDSSSTSMICYAIRRGVKLNILSNLYVKNTDLGLTALYKNTINGIVKNCSAECRGIGMYPQKYGNFPWAQGPTTSLVAISLDVNNSDI